jgi:hypothetical protein
MANHYSPSEFIKTGYSLLMTKLTFPQARLIRRPVYNRGGYHCRAEKALQQADFADSI